MADELQDQGEGTDDQARLPEPGSDRLLTDAVSNLRGRLRSEEARDPSSEWDLREKGFRRVLQWAKDEGCYYEHLRFEEVGGKEHDLTLDASSRSYLKFTRPNLAGFSFAYDPDERCFELNTSDPIAYLERLALHTEVFGIDMSFVGVSGPDYRHRLITRQCNIPGRHATHEEILNMMLNYLGFEYLPGFAWGYKESASFIREDVVALDLRPLNVRVTEGGLPIVVDVICARLDDEELNAFRAFVGLT